MIDGTKSFTVIIFEITNNCNKNCEYCAKMPRKSDKIKYLKIEDYKYVISCMNKKDREHIRKVVITGGEPLLHLRFIELISLMRKDFPKAELEIISNGKLIKKLPQKNLRVLPNIKNISFKVSEYPKWNDDIIEIYDNNYKPPNIWKRLVNKIMTSKFIEHINLDYRFPIITNKIKRFILDPLKRGNVYIAGFEGFWNPYGDPNISKKAAKIIRSICSYNMFIIGKNLYNCCMAEQLERYYNTEPVHIEFDENWKKNSFKIPTWKVCINCRMGVDMYNLDNVNTKINNYNKYIDIETRRKITNIKGHE